MWLQCGDVFENRNAPKTTPVAASHTRWRACAGAAHGPPPAAVRRRRQASSSAPAGAATVPRGWRWRVVALPSQWARCRTAEGVGRRAGEINEIYDTILYFTVLNFFL